MQRELKKGESTAQGVRRIALEHADAALDALVHPRSAGGLTEAIHEVRKRIKRARSALRLLRPAIGRRRFEKLDRLFRKAGNGLSESRDAAAALETLDILTEHHAGVLRPHAFAEVRAHLAERHLRSLWQTIEDGRHFVLSTHRLERARAKLESTSMSWTDEEPLWMAPVRRSFKRARRDMRKALDSGAPEDFHAWRRKSKHLRHHLSLLEPVWAGHLDEASRLLNEVTDLLGEHHDLVGLGATLRGTPAVRTTDARRGEIRAILGLIEGRRIEIEEDVEVVGRRLFSREPDEVAARLRTLWSAWLADFQEGPADTQRLDSHPLSA